MQDAADCEFLVISDLLKAMPSEEGGARFIYLEASNEARDIQGEVVLAKALAESADYYAKYGNIDFDHVTVYGARAGIENYPVYEIGRPVSVRVSGRDTFVKAAIYTGDTPIAANANIFWDSITKLSPAQRWYPSVGGAVLDKGTEMGPNGPRTVVRKVRWTNIGLSKTPVNPQVPTVTTVPFGVLAKSWSLGGGLDLTKALEAGYGTDSASLTGGAAMRKQSLSRKPRSYVDFREALAGDLRKNLVGGTAEAITNHASRHYGLGDAEAADWCGRFLSDLRAGLHKRTMQ